MSILMRASEINKRPVVTFGGEDVAEIKDIVYAENGGAIGGFSLNGRAFFSSTMKVALPWKAVFFLGPDAVMITDESVLLPTDEVLAQAAAQGVTPRGDVIGSEVLTDDGTSLGKVIDVIIEVGDNPGDESDVIGFEIEPSQGMGDTGRLLIPLPDTLAASGEHLMVPAAAREFVSHDLAGFGAAVKAFRSRFEGKI